MQRAFDGVAFDVPVRQAGPHVGAVTVRGMHAAIDHEERKSPARNADGLGEFRIEIGQRHDVMPFGVLLISGRQGEEPYAGVAAERLFQAFETWNPMAAGYPLRTSATWLISIAFRSGMA